MREGSEYLGDFSNKLCLLRLHDLCRETNTNTLIISVFADTHWLMCTNCMWLHMSFLIFPVIRKLTVKIRPEQWFWQSLCWEKNSTLVFTVIFLIYKIQKNSDGNQARKSIYLSFTNLNLFFLLFKDPVLMTSATCLFVVPAQMLPLPAVPLLRKWQASQRAQPCRGNGCRSQDPSL